MRIRALDRLGGPGARNRPDGASGESKVEVIMTPDDYVGRSKALRIELERIRNLLDERAKAVELGIQPSAALGSKLQADWDNVLESIKQLEKKFWGK